MVDRIVTKVGDFMRKINGRHKKTEKAESEKLIGKPYKCERCSHVEFRKHVEFGEELRCPECGAVLRELIRW
jgi:predicted Zn-ribbon and HTH transcriptional regulator